jgi:hypothetical protein
MVKRRTISNQYLVLMLEGTVGGVYTYHKENDTGLYVAEFSAYGGSLHVEFNRAEIFPST